MLEVLRQLPPLHIVEVLEQRFPNPNDDRQYRQQKQLLARIGDTEFGDERILATHHHIDRNADQNLWQYVKEFVQHRVNRGQGGIRSMATRIREQSL